MKDRRKFHQESKELRRNHRIRITPVRLIDEDENQVGVVETRDAIARALELGLDLVEVSPTAKPPVCRIMDYGKYKYALAKKERKSKANRHETELKEVRIRTPKIDKHDLGIKLNHAREFLERGDRVQFSLRFRGRELAHIDEGRNVFETIKKLLSDVSKVDQNYRFEGRRLSMLLSPLSEQIRKNTKPASATETPAPPAAETPAAPAAVTPAPPAAVTPAPPAAETPAPPAAETPAPPAAVTPATPAAETPAPPAAETPAPPAAETPAPQPPAAP